MALDLAIQAAGLVSMPVADLSNLKGARAWAAPAGKSGPEGLEHVALPAWEAAREAPFPDRPAGGVLLEGRQVTQEDLFAEAERLQQLIGGEERQVVVAGRPPERWPDRALLAWATLAGAAVLLAPDLVPSALWARPTVFQGTAAEVAALRRALEPKPPRFWRLRVLLCDEPVEEGFWQERGVRVERLTPC